MAKDIQELINNNNKYIKKETKIITVTQQTEEKNEEQIQVNNFFKPVQNLINQNLRDIFIQNTLGTPETLDRYTTIDTNGTEKSRFNNPITVEKQDFKKAQANDNAQLVEANGISLNPDTIITEEEAEGLKAKKETDEIDITGTEKARFETPLDTTVSEKIKEKQEIKVQQIVPTEAVKNIEVETKEEPNKTEKGIDTIVAEVGKEQTIIEPKGISLDTIVPNRTGNLTLSKRKTYPELKEKLNEQLRQRTEGLRTTRPGEIGFLYAKPVSTGTFYKPFRIPFEFNPKITESGLSAKYNAVSFLSRIGDIQNFVGVSPLTISINTDYEVLSAGSSNNDNADYWMSFYTLDNLDKIEMAYRSLIMPDFVEKDDDLFWK